MIFQKIKKHLKEAAALTIILFVSACTTPPTMINELPPKSGFTSDAKVGVIWLSRCSASVGCKESSSAATLGEFTPVGASGLLVYGGVMSAHQEIIDALDTADATSTIESAFLDYSKNVLQENGFSVSVERTPFYPGSLKKTKRHQAIQIGDIVTSNVERSTDRLPQYLFEQSYDFNTIASDMNADYILALELLQFNVNRDFGPFAIPLTQPHAASAVRLQLLEVATNNLLLNDYAFNEQFVVDGNWKQPNNWENLLAAVDMALKTAVDQVTSRFSSAIASR